jgi:transcriptional regulator with XRE-family HTH domain
MWHMSQARPVDLTAFTPPERLAWIRREVFRVTQGELAERVSAAGCQTTQTTISNVESGRRSPGLALALALEQVAGIPAKDWVESRREVA